MSDHPLSYWLSDSDATGRLWRSILLFGSNTTAYKFALGGALLELASAGKESVNVQDLSIPFAKRICDHLKVEDRQGTNPSNSFLNACRQFNADEIEIGQLVGTTVSHGYRYVFDKFHIVGREDVPMKFFTIEGSSRNTSIHLSESLLTLDKSNYSALESEVESRWRIVETSWATGVPSRLLDVEIDGASEKLIVKRGSSTRKSVGQAKWALNTYQDGKCFYCNTQLDTTYVVETKTQVDHVIPLRLQDRMMENLHHVWNLVNACADCNLSKSDRMPPSDTPRRLQARNEYYIRSNHPFKSAIENATGRTLGARQETIKQAFANAANLMPTRWSPS